MSGIYIYVTPFFPAPTNWRGAYCLDFVKALERQFKSKSVECKVVVMTEGDGTDYEIGGVKVHTFRVKRLPSNIFPFLFNKYNQRSFLAKVKEVLTPLFDFDSELQLFSNVEICHAHTANYGVYAEAMKKVNPRCKTLLHHHDLQSFGLNNGVLRHCWLYNMIQFPILRRMHEQIDTHVFISEAARRSFLAAPDTSWTQYGEYKKQMRGLPYRSVKIKDSIILHNGVDKNVFRVVENSGSGTKDVSMFMIGCVGNFSVLKDQLGLLKAIEILNHQSTTTTKNYNLKLRFVGSGETLEECKKFAAENGIDAEFLSEMRHEQLPDFYHSLDFFVLPSWFEGFGCVFTEAHSCGVPFITCEGQGISDIIADEGSRSEGVGSRWLCKQRDPEDIAKKIGDAIELKSRVEVEEWKTIQKLNEDQDIDKLVVKFVEEIGL